MTASASPTGVLLQAPVRHRRPWRAWLAGGLAALLLLVGTAAIEIGRSPLPLGTWLQHPVGSFLLSEGVNPQPVQLVRPVAAPLSAMAQLGHEVFFDTSLSSSGKLSCASCHSPQHDYGPPSDLPAVFGGPDLKQQGVRAVPSLMYLERQPNFSVGPDNEENETVTLAQLAAAAQSATRTQKTATDTAATAANLVPQGGLFWDGRADTLQDQTMGPLLSPFEMDGGSVARVASKLAQAPYAARMRQLFGPNIFAESQHLIQRRSVLPLQPLDQSKPRLDFVQPFWIRLQIFEIIANRVRCFIHSDDSPAQSLDGASHTGIDFRQILQLLERPANLRGFG